MANTDKRPKRPTEEFLLRIGIAELPPNVDLSFNDGHVNSTAFYIEELDENGETILATSVDAWSTSKRGLYDIHKNLKETLVHTFGAKPLGLH